MLNGLTITSLSFSDDTDESKKRYHLSPCFALAESGEEPKCEGSGCSDVGSDHFVVGSDHFVVGSDHFDVGEWSQ